MNMQNKKWSALNEKMMKKKHGLSFFLSFLVLILSLICIHLCIQQNIYIMKKKDMAHFSLSIITFFTSSTHSHSHTHTYTRQSDLFLFLSGRWHFTCFIFARPFFFVLPIHCFSFYTWMRNIKWKIKVKMKWFGITKKKLLFPEIWLGEHDGRMY